MQIRKHTGNTHSFEHEAHERVTKKALNINYKSIVTVEKTKPRKPKIYLNTKITGSSKYKCRSRLSESPSLYFDYAFIESGRMTMYMYWKYCAPTTLYL